jgi:hypothetical protein
LSLHQKNTKGLLVGSLYRRSSSACNNAVSACNYFGFRAARIYYHKAAFNFGIFKEDRIFQNMLGIDQAYMTYPQPRPMCYEELEPSDAMLFSDDIVLVSHNRSLQFSGVCQLLTDCLRGFRFNGSPFCLFFDVPELPFAGLPELTGRAPKREREYGKKEGADGDYRVMVSLDELAGAPNRDFERQKEIGDTFFKGLFGLLLIGTAYAVLKRF